MRGKLLRLRQLKDLMGTLDETLSMVMRTPDESLNLKALTRTLDETEVGSFQGVVGVETLDILHGIEEHACKSLHFD
ncbi:hypothetical protein TrST_g11829 [Triparma strigata]|uniref:Uncharacterized protein n=1 Tax=Triparma strigata TaxID=1606541 RepID=A0A9W7CA01_9STRA|nr:hypothetical protein TrST_g11829 [Triparma strigata]